MLTITEEAATLIRTLRQDAELREQAGLRMVVDPTNLSLSMDLAETPAAGDTVVDRFGARVFLSPSAAHRLGEGTLQAEIAEERSRFFLDR
jgi:iron-sulfur cluster assembly protein